MSPDVESRSDPRAASKISVWRSSGPGHFWCSLSAVGQAVEHSRGLADAQADQLLLFGVERQLEIICAAVERLVEIDAGISERITDYGELSPSAGSSCAASAAQGNCRNSPARAKS